LFDFIVQIVSPFEYAHWHPWDCIGSIPKIRDRTTDRSFT
jgi:hypothetical protein